MHHALYSYLVNGDAEAGMIVRGTSVIDVGGVAGYSNAYEEKGGQELSHTGKMKLFDP